MNLARLLIVLCAVPCIYALIFILAHYLPQTTEEYDIVCPEENSFVPHHNCSLYYVCGKWIPYLQECPPGTYFNPDTTNCELPNDVGECNEGTTPTEGTITSTAAIAETLPVL